MFLSLDACRDPNAGQILTITDSPPLPHLSDFAEKKWGSRICWHAYFVSSFDTCSQEIIRYIFLHYCRSLGIMGGNAFGSQLSSSHARDRFESSRHYNRRFDFQRHDGLVAMVCFLSLRLIYLLRSWADFLRIMCFRGSHWWRWTLSFAYKLGKVWRNEITLTFFSLLQNSPKTLTLLHLLLWTVRHVFSLPLHQVEERKGGGKRRTMSRLLLSGSLAGCVALVPVNDLLWHISCRDKVSQSRVTCRILTSTWSGDLVSNSLNLERASFDLEAWSLFPNGV